MREVMALEGADCGAEAVSVLGVEGAGRSRRRSRCACTGVAWVTRGLGSRCCAGKTRARVRGGTPIDESFGLEVRKLRTERGLAAEHGIAPDRLWRGGGCVPRKCGTAAWRPVLWAAPVAGLR